MQVGAQVALHQTDGSRTERQEASHFCWESWCYSSKKRKENDGSCKRVVPNSNHPDRLLGALTSPSTRLWTHKKHTIILFRYKLENRKILSPEGPVYVVGIACKKCVVQGYHLSLSKSSCPCGPNKFLGHCLIRLGEEWHCAATMSCLTKPLSHHCSGVQGKECHTFCQGVHVWIPDCCLWRFPFAWLNQIWSRFFDDMEKFCEAGSLEAR